MTMFSIVTDTSANLDSAYLKAHDVTVVPFTFLVGDEERTCIDTAAFDGAAYYSAMRTGTSVRTSQVTPQRYIEHLRPLLEGGNDVLYIGMSSGISGSFSSASMAAKELRKEFPARTILLVDTLSASLGEGLLVMRAVDCREQGFTLEETASLLDRLRHAMCQVFTVEDLKYLRATGRISNIKAALAAVLHIKPILKGDVEGKIVCAEKVRGRKRSIETLAAQYNEYVRSADAQTIGIAHADCPEEAEQLGKLLCRYNPPKRILTVCYEPVTGAHVGPGTLALFFLGDGSFRKCEQ